MNALQESLEAIGAPTSRPSTRQASSIGQGEELRAKIEMPTVRMGIPIIWCQAEV